MEDAAEKANLKCRNPFTLSGHFKSKSLKEVRNGQSRNPFNFSGHFKMGRYLERAEGARVAIPSTFQGISSLKCEEIIDEFWSQSLQLFRAFQVKIFTRLTRNDWVAIPSTFQGISSQVWAGGSAQLYPVAIPSTFQGISSRSEIRRLFGLRGRNPFNFSGHFKSYLSKLIEIIGIHFKQKSNILVSQYFLHPQQFCPFEGIPYSVFKELSKLNYTHLEFQSQVTHLRKALLISL